MAKKVDPADLVGAHEIAERLGLSFPTMVHTWRRRHPDFPEPVAELKAGLIWNWNDIRAWLDKTDRGDGDERLRQIRRKERERVLRTHDTDR